MEYTDKEYCIEAWGDYACFTRPELKVERVSYDIITPSAARAIYEAIFWKPAIRWQISKIEVLNPIQWFSVRRNEVGAIATPKTVNIFIEEKRQQKNALILKDVKYRIYAKQIFIPISKRKKQTREGGDDENPGKYNAMFERRAEKGQCFNQPYLGTREFSAYYRLVKEGEEKQAAIKEDKDLGIMLYDMDFSNEKETMAMFFHAKMENGTIIVPPIESEEILR
jgi:CRISPR-associated protein Cas5d